MSSVEALLLILETALPSVLKSKGQSSVVHVQYHRDFTQARNITQCPGHNENLIVKLFSGGEELEFWRELAAVLEDFLFNEVYAWLYIVYYVHILISHFFLVFWNSHRPDGVQLTAEQLREHEAIDIKVPHMLLILCSRYFNNTHSCVLVIECLFVVPIYISIFLYAGD